MGRARKAARIRKWRGGWYLWHYDTARGCTVRVACASLGAHDDAGRSELLANFRNKERSAEAERVMRGAAALFDTPLLGRIDAFVADVNARAELRRSMPGSREGLSASAAFAYQGVMRDFRNWVEATHITLTTGQLEPATLQEYVTHLATTKAANGRARNSATLNKHRGHLKTFVNWLAIQRPRLLPDPDLLRHALKRTRTPARELEAYSVDSLLAFREALTPRCVQLFDLLRGTGCRLGEALALSWDDVDLHAGRVIIRASKTGKTRFVPLKETAPALLKAMKQWSRAKPPCGTTFYPRKDWEAAQAVAHVSPQGIRRTFVSVCIAQGVTAGEAAGWLGHSVMVLERWYLMQVPRKRARSIAAAMGW